jgi:putative FmdB family regulatory protein
MPIYEYRCRACEHEFERFVPTPAATVACPRCASDRVARRLSLFGARTAGRQAGETAAASAGPGGCCGGGCGCA